MSVFVGIVMALAQVVKQLEVVAVKCIPVLNLLFGVALCLFVCQGDIKEAVFQGIVVGLSASGLFSSGKNIMESVVSGDIE